MPTQKNYLEKELYELVKHDSRLFDFIQAGSLDGIWYWDLENPEHEWMSDRFWETLGYEPSTKKHLAAEWQEIINQDDLAVATDNFNKHLADPDHPYDQLVRYTHKDGSTVHIRCRGLAIRDENGKPIRMLGAHTNMTEVSRKLAAAEQRKKMEHEQIFLAAGLGIARVSPTGDWLEVNDKLCSMLGYSKEELLQKTFQDITHPDDLDADLTYLHQMLDGSINNYSMEKRYFKKDGSILWIKLSVTLVWSEEGSPEYFISIIDDISEKKEYEQRLQREKKKFEALMNDAPDAYFVMKKESGEIVDCNKAAEQVLRADKAKILGLTPDVLSPKYQPDGRSSEEYARENIKRINEQGYGQFDHYHRRMDGETFWANVTVSLVDFDGEDCMFVSWRDISEQKQAAKLIQEQKEETERLKNAFDQHSIVAVTDIDGKIVSINEKFEAISGYTKEELIGQNHRLLNSGHQPKAYWQQMYETVKSGRVWHDIVRNVNKAGDYYWVDTTIVPFYRNSELVNYISIRTDVTNLKAMEMQILDQRNELETIFNTSKDGIALLDLESNFLRVNKAYIAITGYTEEELLQKSCIGMSIPEDIPRAEKALAEVFENGFIENFEKSCFRKDGSIFTINMSIAIMPDNEHLLITTKDITEEVSLRNELVSAKEKAELISRFKSEFLANMSHEIRTPMNGILGFVEQLEKHENDPQRLKQFNMIRSSGNTLLHIINDILDFSKIESGKMKLESQPLSLYEVISETTGIFSELIGSKCIDFDKSVDERIPGCMLGDQVRIKQVIFNLLSNAIKFTPENGTITLDATLEENGQWVRLTITDTGIGIPKEKIDRIFEAFGQQDTSTTRKYGGTGLGLNIASSLIKKMGGVLDVESIVGEGSSFYFTLPVRTCPDELLSDSQADDDLEGVRFDGHVLIVEDNKTNQMLLSIILDDFGLSYDIANDGVEAIKRFDENRYDIIMMDENMPNMNGIEATNQIRLMEHDDARDPTPIVAVTANALAEDRQRFLDAGMDDYLSKPYEEKDIVNVLKRYLS
jgi:PAS domain S-box-containing protein